MAAKKKVSVKKEVFTRGNDECCGSKGGNCSGGVYFFGLIGAAVYYIQQATTFWAGVVGVLKALVWPAFVVFKLLEFLK